MIPKPAKRSFVQRSLLASGAAFLWLWKSLRLPRSIWPRPLRAMLDHWTPEMYRMIVGSWVTRAYIDQPCRLEIPEDPRLDVEVAEELRLTREQLDRFWRDGWLGPFDAFDRHEVRRLKRLLLDARERTSSIYHCRTDRDLHLELPDMRRAMARPAIVERAAQLLGPDLLCWRSQVFCKDPGDAAIHWHQASTYLLEDYLEPALVPPDRDRLFQLTVWVALDPARSDNGCLRFIPGTHDRIRPLRLGGEGRFYQVSYELELEDGLRPPVEVEVGPGQFLIFSERVVHGSGANRSRRPRTAFNFRLVPPDVSVYPDKKLHRAMHMGQIYNLETWGALLLRGQDRVGINRYADIAAP